jgi:hypothetical protein
MTPPTVDEASRTKRPARVTLLIVLVVVLLVGGIWWFSAARHQATPWVVEGDALGGPGAISLHDASMGRFNNEGFVPAGAMWRVKDGAWHDGGDRSCLKDKPNTGAQGCWRFSASVRENVKQLRTDEFRSYGGSHLPRAGDTVGRTRER